MGGCGRLRALATLGSTALAAACGGMEGADSGSPEGLGVLRLDSVPTLEIGTVEGDPDYALENVMAIAHTSSGQIIVGDQGADRISIYSPTGSIVRHIGRRGEGPGEFRDLVGAYARAADTIEAADGQMRNILVFDSTGTYVRQYAASEASRDSLFPMDLWLYRRFFVHGARNEAERTAARAAMDALPLPTASPGFRIVRIWSDGTLWIREPEVVGGRFAWIVADGAGRPTSVIELPERFEPMDVQGASVTGRWQDANDVNFVRTYRFGATDERRPLPTWLTPDTTQVRPPAPTEEEFRAAVRAGIRNMAIQQEMYYSTHRSYTAELDSLEWERPEGMEAHFINGDERGWGAVFTNPSFDRICALTYGFNVPAGWSPGGMLCAP